MKMIKTLLAIPSILMVVCHFIPNAHADLLCGVYRLNIKPSTLKVNNKPYPYVTSQLGAHGEYLHEFANGNRFG